MPTAHVNGAELYYEERGRGAPILLIHGNGDVFWGEEPLEELAGSYRVIAYHRRGFSRSPHPPAQDLHVHAEDAAALLAALDASPATVVGWSAGGVVALDLAASHPELVSSLVLAEASLHLRRRPTASLLRFAVKMEFHRRLRGDQGAAAATLYRWALGYRTGGNAFDRFPQAWRSDMMDNAPTVVVESDQASGEHLSGERIATICCPVLCLLGELSDPTFVRSTGYLTKLLPHARVRHVSGAAHAIHFDKSTEFVAAVREGAAGAQSAPAAD